MEECILQQVPSMFQFQNSSILSQKLIDSQSQQGLRNCRYHTNCYIDANQVVTILGTPSQGEHQE